MKGPLCQCGRCGRCLVTKLVWVYGWDCCDVELTRYFWSGMQSALRKRSVHDDGR